MKNQQSLALTIMFLTLQFVLPLYIALFTQSKIMNNNFIMWYAISSGVMACILAAIYIKHRS